MITQSLIDLREALYRLRRAGAQVGGMTEDHRLVLIEAIWPTHGGVVGSVEWDEEEEQWVIDML